MQTNVIRLPSAAARKVINPPALRQLSVAEGLPQHPAVWHDHGGRKPWQEASIHRSAEMLVISAIFSVLAVEQKDRIRQALDTINMMNLGDHSATALHIVENMR